MFGVYSMKPGQMSGPWNASVTAARPPGKACLCVGWCEGRGECTTLAVCACVLCCRLPIAIVPGALWFPGDRHDSRYSMSPLKLKRSLQLSFLSFSSWFQEMFKKNKVVMLLLSSTSHSLCLLKKLQQLRFQNAMYLNISLWGGCFFSVPGKSDPCLLFPQ